jgi:hypothetical protein
MLKKLALYATGLIAIFLFVNNSTGAGTDIKAVENFTTGETTALQGR